MSSPLPHDIVALICDVHEKLVRELREALYPCQDFPRKTFVQKRILERHAFDRFALFIGICLYEFLVRKGLSNVHAFLQTIEALEHSPTIKVNQFEDCHLAVNLYHWLAAHGLLPHHSQIEKRATLQDFPQNFRDFIEYHPKLKIPPIRKMGIFPIPDSLDKEHKTLLIAVNDAILNHCSLKPLLQKYYEGGFQ